MMYNVYVSYSYSEVGLFEITIGWTASREKTVLKNCLNSFKLSLTENKDMTKNVK